MKGKAKKKVEIKCVRCGRYHVGNSLNRKYCPSCAIDIKGKKKVEGYQIIGMPRIPGK